MHDVSTIKRRRVKRGAADDPGRACAGEGGGLAQRPRDAHLGVWGRSETYADDDVPPARQRLPDRIPRSTAHDDRAAERQLLEMLEIVRQVPWQPSGTTD